MVVSSVVPAVVAVGSEVTVSLALIVIVSGPLGSVVVVVESVGSPVTSLAEVTVLAEVIDEAEDAEVVGVVGSVGVAEVSPMPKVSSPVVLSVSVSDFEPPPPQASKSATTALATW